MLTINEQLRPRSLWPFWRRSRRRVLAVFAYRYDAHLVPDLITNITPLVDGWVSLDDRQNPAPLSTDAQRRHQLIEAAHRAGAQWILAVDPDERFEQGLAAKMDELTAERGHFAYSFALRELYTPDQYRVDGAWGSKRQSRLFPIFEDLFPISEKYSFPDTALHARWTPPWFKAKASGFNLYHLKMIDPMRRQARSTLYQRLDPQNRFQSIGYSYLADETGAQFEKIPPGREYRPVHRDDGGLWMVDPAQVSGIE